MSTPAATTGTQDTQEAKAALGTPQENEAAFKEVSQNLVTAKTTIENLRKYILPNYPQESLEKTEHIIYNSTWGAPKVSEDPGVTAEDWRNAKLASPYSIDPDDEGTNGTYESTKLNLFSFYALDAFADLTYTVKEDGKPNFFLDIGTVSEQIKGGFGRPGTWTYITETSDYFERMLNHLEQARVNFVDDLSFDKYNSSVDEALTLINSVRALAVRDRLLFKSIKAFVESPDPFSSNSSANGKGQQLRIRRLAENGITSLPKPPLLENAIIQINRIITDLDKVKNLIDAKGKQKVHKDLLKNVLLFNQGFVPDAKNPEEFVTRPLEKDPWGVRFSVRNGTIINGKELVKTTNERLKRVQDTPLKKDAKILDKDKEEEEAKLEAIDEDVLEGTQIFGRDTYYMHLLPAMKSNLPIQGGTDVPGALPGLNFSIKHNIVKHKVPGFQPIYQPLGVDCIKCTLVGCFTGADGVNLWNEDEQDDHRKKKGSTTMPLEFTGRSDPFEGYSALLKSGKSLAVSDVVGITRAYDSFKNAQNFYNMIIAPGKEVEVEINLKKVDIVSEGGADGPLRNATTGNPEFRALVKSMDIYYTRADRTWYIMDLEITDAGLISNECLNLSKDFNNAVEALDEATRRRTEEVANDVEIRRCIDQVCQNDPSNCRTYNDSTGTKKWVVDLLSGRGYTGNIADETVDDILDPLAIGDAYIGAVNGDVNAPVLGGIGIFNSFDVMKDYATLLYQAYNQPQPTDNASFDESSLSRPGFSITQRADDSSNPASKLDPDKYSWDRENERFVELSTNITRAQGGSANPFSNSNNSVKSITTTLMLQSIMDGRTAVFLFGENRKNALKNLNDMQRHFEGKGYRKDTNFLCDAETITRRLGQINEDGVRTLNDSGDTTGTTDKGSNNSWSIDGIAPILQSEDLQCSTGSIINTLFQSANAARVGSPIIDQLDSSASNFSTVALNNTGLYGFGPNSIDTFNFSGQSVATDRVFIQENLGPFRSLEADGLLTAYKNDEAFYIIGTGVAEGLVVTREFFKRDGCGKSFAAGIAALNTIREDRISVAIKQVFFGPRSSDYMVNDLIAKLDNIDIEPIGFTGSAITVDLGTRSINNGIQQSSNASIKLTGVTVNFGAERVVKINSSNYSFPAKTTADIWLALRGGFSSGVPEGTVLLSAVRFYNLGDPVAIEPEAPPTEQSDLTSFLPGGPGANVLLPDNIYGA